jgi:hypothetical protein
MEASLIGLADLLYARSSRARTAVRLRMIFSALQVFQDIEMDVVVLTVYHAGLSSSA